MSNRKIGMFRSALLILPFALLSIQPAQADTIGWTDWSTASSGNIAIGSGISVTYTGQTIGLSTNYPSWTPTSSFSGNNVSNAPPQAFNAVALTGGSTQLNTITFSSPIVNPVMAIWSLGSPSIQASFDFTPEEPFTLQASGPNAEYGGSGLIVSGNDVFGAEGNGTIQFQGTFSELTWTNPTNESYYAFTIGVAGEASPTPEPASMILSSAGLVALACFVIGRRRRQHTA